MKTLDQFYAELRKVTEGGVKWRIGDDGEIRWTGNPVDCPWLVVRRTLHTLAEGKHFSYLTPYPIACAADNDPGHDPAIRAKLLECCGLEERA